VLETGVSSGHRVLSMILTHSRSRKSTTSLRYVTLR